MNNMVVTSYVGQKKIRMLINFHVLMTQTFTVQVCNKHMCFRSLLDLEVSDQKEKHVKQ